MPALSRHEVSPRSRLPPWIVALWRAGLALVLGLAVWFLASLMTGAGHGTASLVASSLAVVTLPCSAVALVYARHHWALALALLAAGGVVASDVVIALLIDSEGREGLERVWRSEPEPLVIWALPWLAVHVLSLRVVVRVVRARSRGLQRIDGYGKCEHCDARFPYYLVHSGFGESAYAYCDDCGQTSLLDGWRMPPSLGIEVHKPVAEDKESRLQACACGGRFHGSAAPRCPHCREVLSAELAAAWLESHMPGFRSGWRWQRSWQGLHAIVIDGRAVHDNWIVPAGEGMGAGDP